LKGTGAKETPVKLRTGERPTAMAPLPTKAKEPTPAKKAMPVVKKSGLPT
jgi:hypothetical protein